MPTVQRHPGHIELSTTTAGVTAMTTRGWNASWTRQHGNGGDIHISIPLTNRGVYFSLSTGSDD